MASQEKNEEIIQDCIKKIDEIFQDLKKNEISCFLSGKDDDYDIYLEIHAGAGGTESQDWADMLAECIWSGLIRKDSNMKL